MPPKAGIHAKRADFRGFGCDSHLRGNDEQVRESRTWVTRNAVW